jgi:thymidylate kinase
MITTKKIPSAIIFFGPDGSGKTTQADMLVKELERNGIKTRKLWLRSLHTLAFIISKLAMHTLKLDTVYEFRAKYSHRRSFRRIWYAIEFISILPLILLRFRLPLMRGYTIVAERYVIDWIVSLSYLSRNELMLESLLAKSVLKFIPQSSILIYVDATFEAIYSRGRREDSREFIEFQRAFYAKLARQLNATIVDTSDKSLSEVHNLICRHALGVSSL